MNLERYEAQAFCTNCGFEGPVSPKVGEAVVDEDCPVCKAPYKSLRSVASREWQRARRGVA